MEDNDRVFRNLAKRKGRRSGAGEPNVRRPLRGFEIKEDTYACIRVIRADGTEIPLFDSSDPTGQSTKYANFLLQSVQESRMEKQQILETFGEPYLFFFGEQPRFLDVSAILLNSLDFNWRAEWWKNYDSILRGTKLVEAGARCYLFYDDIIVEGYMLQAQVVETADNPLFMPLNFRMFISNAMNISLIGDPNYPIRDSLQLPEGVDLTDASANSRLALKQKGAYPGPGEMASEVFTAYLKQVGAVQLKQQMANAQSLAEAQRLQAQYQAQLLGLQHGDIDILASAYGGAKDFLDNWKKGGPDAAFSGIAESINQGLKDVKDGIVSNITDSVKDALSKEPEFNAQQAYEQILRDLGYLRTLPDGTEQVSTEINQDLVNRMLEERKQQFYANQWGARFNLADVLRRGLLYSTPYPGQNIDQFLRNAAFSKYQALKPPPGLERTLPLRGKIADNRDEYTNPPQDGTDPLVALRKGSVGAPAKNPMQLMNDEVCKRGGQLSPQAFYGFGMVNWSPGQGVTTKSGSIPGLPNSLGVGQATGFGGTGNGPARAVIPGKGGYVLALGKGFKPTFSRVAGATPSVGGAHGGAMGGGIGPGVGGALGGYGAQGYNDPSVPQFGDPIQQQLAQNPFGPSGDPYGLGFGSFANSPALTHLYTDGYAPDGSFVGTQSAPTNPGLFGGGGSYGAIAKLGPGSKGDGVFGIQSIPGSLGQGGSCSPTTSNVST